jgi:hypothetical protein
MRRRRRIFTTTPSGVNVTPTTATPSMAIMRLNAVVARTSFLSVLLAWTLRNYEHYVRAI